MLKLQSRLALFLRDESQATAPRGSGPAAAETVWCLSSWGSQVELVETGEYTLSLAVSTNSEDPVLDLYVRSAISLVQNEELMLSESNSEGMEVDKQMVDSAEQFP